MGSLPLSHLGSPLEATTHTHTLSHTHTYTLTHTQTHTHTHTHTHTLTHTLSHSHTLTHTHTHTHSHTLTHGAGGEMRGNHQGVWVRNLRKLSGPLCPSQEQGQERCHRGQTRPRTTAPESDHLAPGWGRPQGRGSGSGCLLPGKVNP